MKGLAPAPEALAGEGWLENRARVVGGFFYTGWQDDVHAGVKIELPQFGAVWRVDWWLCLSVF